MPAVTEKRFNEFLQEELRHHKSSEDEMIILRAAGANASRDIAQLRKTIYGNGDPGMDELVRSIAAWVEEQKKRAADKTAEWRKYVFWGATFVASQLIGYFIARMSG
jgi:hypothetical protein